MASDSDRPSRCSWADSDLSSRQNSLCTDLDSVAHNSGARIGQRATRMSAEADSDSGGYDRAANSRRSEAGFDTGRMGGGVGTSAAETEWRGRWRWRGESSRAGESAREGVFRDGGCQG